MVENTSRACEDEKHGRRVVAAHLERLTAPQLGDMDVDATLTRADQAGPRAESRGAMSGVNTRRTAGAHRAQRQRCVVGRTLEADFDHSAWPAAESVGTPRRHPHRVAGPNAPLAILLEQNDRGTFEDDEEVVRLHMRVQRKLDAGRNGHDHR